MKTVFEDGKVKVQIGSRGDVFVENKQEDVQKPTRIKITPIIGRGLRIRSGSDLGLTNNSSLRKFDILVYS